MEWRHNIGDDDCGPSSISLPLFLQPRSFWLWLKVYFKLVTFGQTSRDNVRERAPWDVDGEHVFILLATIISSLHAELYVSQTIVFGYEIGKIEHVSLIRAL